MVQENTVRIQVYKEKQVLICHNSQTCQARVSILADTRDIFYFLCGSQICLWYISITLIKYIHLIHDWMSAEEMGNKELNFQSIWPLIYAHANYFRSLPSNVLGGQYLNHVM